MIDEAMASRIEELIFYLCCTANLNSTKKGFWRDFYEMLTLAYGTNEGDDIKRGEKYKVDTKLSKLALITSEIGEAVEAVRKPCADSHCSDFTAEEIELADVLIRIFDYCGEFGLRLGEAIIAKMEYNASRPHMHGKSA